MPIVRWHGWAAKCRLCGKFVDLGDGNVAWKERDEIKESLEIRPGDPVDEIIAWACGCARRTRRKGGR